MEHKAEVELEKEVQKTRQRSLEEIKNPDRVLEIILKMKRGEEVTIPLAAFDYIYRNMSKFSLINKEGKITIVNQEDYFKFKEQALKLLELEEKEKLDIKAILEKIDEVNATSPIEITEHEDGTVVKVDHIQRTVEILKPNGEKIFIDHKNDTVVSQNLIEQKEKKEGSASNLELIKKDQKIKNLEDQNALLKGKKKREENTKKPEAKEEQKQEEERVEEMVQNSAYFSMQGDVNNQPNLTQEPQTKVILQPTFTQAGIVETKKPEEQVVLQKSINTATLLQERPAIPGAPWEYLSAHEFIQNITFSNIEAFLHYITSPELSQKALKQLKTYLSVNHGSMFSAQQFPNAFSKTEPNHNQNGFGEYVLQNGTKP